MHLQKMFTNKLEKFNSSLNTWYHVLLHIFNRGLTVKNYKIYDLFDLFSIIKM